MTETELLDAVVAKLIDAGIPFMLTGSVASSYHGEPRSTHDIDIVVDPTWPDLKRFIDSFGPPFYVSEVAAREAYDRRRIFSIIHPESLCNVDIIVRKDEPFARAEFERRERGVVWDVELDVASPEDIILSKLRWSKRAESERQYRDAYYVAKVQANHLDIGYLRRWADEIHVDDLLDRLLDDIGEEPR